MAYERWLSNKEIRDKWRQERENAPKITLHFVDEMTGRTSTFEIPNYYTCGNLTDHVASYGFLAKSRYSNLRYSIRELQEYRPYIKIKDTCLCNGDTLHVEFADVVMLRKSGTIERFFEEYEVTVQWKKIESRFYALESSDQQYTEKFLCHGYETKSGIEEMLRREHAPGRDYLQFRIRESSWPDYRAGNSIEPEETKYLCQISKDQKVLLLAEAEMMEQDLYGCPTAKIFHRVDKLQNCSVEIVDYI